MICYVVYDEQNYEIETKCTVRMNNYDFKTKIKCTIIQTHAARGI